MNDVEKPKCGCIACPYYDESIEVMHCPYAKRGEKGWPCWGRHISRSRRYIGADVVWESPGRELL
jgi:hypothetical protein